MSSGAHQTGRDADLQLNSATRDRLMHASTATITSQLLRRGFRNTFMGGVVPLTSRTRMVGRAFTLRYVPAREDLGMQVDFANETNVQRLAIEAISAEQVLVIDARGEMGSASLGHILATRMLVRGASGLVTDGALRDTPRLRTLELPIYARAAHATTSSVKHFPADLNVPIGCGGVLVMPGDVVVGDAEGVVVIPQGLEEDVAAEASEQETLEEFLLNKVRLGSSIRGVYPPNSETLEEFDASRSGDLSDV